MNWIQPGIFYRYALFVALLASVLCLWTSSTLAEEDPPVDVRVLIDVSGSMKKNDPANLRSPAVKLLLSLLPKNSRSGVWAFDGSVAELAPPGKASVLWKDKALKAMDQIHSKGMFTDIEKAITTAIADWTEPAPMGKRNLIILTDGVVDVSQSPLDNFRARKRILNEQLPLLKEQNIRINSIALSTQADQDLLSALSSESGGWNETATQADQLQRIFLRMFKKAVPGGDSLPIKNNRFQIDRSIKEFSAILFHSKGARATQLEDPEGMDFGQESHRKNVKWRHQPGYDIVTVKRPIEGEWNFVATKDPDNEIMIVTNLQMHVSTLPNEIEQGKAYRLEMFVTEKDKPVVKQNFLDIFKVSLRLSHAGGKAQNLGMPQDSKKPGVFAQAIGPDLELGLYELVVEVDGNTFQRQHKQTFAVVEPTEAAPVIDPIPEISPEPKPAPAPTEQPPVEPSIPEPVLDTPPTTKPESEPEADAVADEEPALHWAIMAGIILGINLLIGGAGFFGYKRYKARQAATEQQLIDKLGG